MRSLTQDLAMAAAAVALLSGVALAGPKDGKKESDDGKGGKPVILQIDASKLPPELLKQLLAAAGGYKKPGVVQKPGEKKPGGDTKPAGEKKPDGENKPGGNKKPAATRRPSQSMN